jgi:hypothetical protein
MGEGYFAISSDFGSVGGYELKANSTATPTGPSALLAANGHFGLCGPQARRGTPNKTKFPPRRAVSHLQAYHPDQGSGLSIGSGQGCSTGNGHI